MKRIALTITILSALGLAIGAMTLARLHKATKIVNQNTFIVGTATGYAPFVSIAPDGSYEGFDVDVMHALAVEMGKELIIKDLGSMPTLFLALEQGSIDAIIWGLSITKPRLAKIDMVRYQGETVTAYPLIFWGPVPRAITGLHDMSGLTVCVEPHSSQDAVLSKFPAIVRLETERVDDALLHLQTGTARAAFVEPAIAAKFMAKYPEITAISIALSPDDYVHGTGIALKKNRPALLQQIIAAVQQLRDRDALQTLEAKWGIAS